LGGCERFMELFRQLFRGRSLPPPKMAGAEHSVFE